MVVGESYTINYTVRNVGHEEASASTTGIIINGVRVYNDPVPALSPYNSYTNTVGPFNLENPPAPDSIEVCADIDDYVFEKRESNNCMADVFALPNLVITSFPPGEWVDPYGNPDPTGSWKRVNLTYMVENCGDAATPHECWTELAKTGGSGSDWSCVDPIPVPVLDVGENVTHTVGPIVVTGDGNNGVRVCVDYNNTIVENGEG